MANRSFDYTSDLTDAPELAEWFGKRENRFNKALRHSWWIWRCIELALVVALSMAIYAIFHNPTCDWMFKCGCTWDWDGGWDRCNIHNPEPPHCPFCSGDPIATWTTSYLVVAMMIVGFYPAQLAVWAVWRRLSRSDQEHVLPLPAGDIEAKPLPMSLALRTKLLLLSWLRYRRADNSYVCDVNACIVSSIIGVVAIGVIYLLINIIVGLCFWLATEGYPTFLWFSR
jgi:hypothetical protein